MPGQLNPELKPLFSQISQTHETWMWEAMSKDAPFKLFIMVAFFTPTACSKWKLKCGDDAIVFDFLSHMNVGFWKTHDFAASWLMSNLAI